MERGPWFCHSCRKDFDDIEPNVQDDEIVCPDCGSAGFMEIVLNGGSSEQAEPPPERPYEQPRSTSPIFPNIVMPLSLARVPRAARGHQLVMDSEDSVRLLPSLRSASRVYTFDITNLGNDRNGIDNIFSNAFLPGPASFDQMVQFIMEQESNNRYGSPPAAVSVVNALPQFSCTEALAGDCAICQEDFIIGEELTRISENDIECPHKFHTNCIVPWLKEHNSCPVCRFELPTDDEEYERRKQEVRQQVLDSWSMSSDNQSVPPPSTAF